MSVSSPVATARLWERMISPLLLFGGAMVLLASVAVDLVGAGEAVAFGLMQILMAGVGFALVVNGMVARDPAVVGSWLDTPVDVIAQTAVKFLSIAVQLGLLFLVIQQFEIENPAFYDTIAVLAFAGFLMHFFVPATHRMLFFLLLSLAAIYLTFGLADGLWLVGIGIALMAICHLPVPYLARVALLVVVGGGLALLRADVWFTTPFSRAVWPILGSMFMFRLVVYLYDLHHAKDRPSITSSLSYFFLLPNVVFPLFPVVDFSTYRRTYYDTDRFAIYQRGVEWIFRGVAQLIIYRFIYQYVTLAPAEVNTPLELIQYVVANFGLYIRVSGQFHLVVGLLHLFGFHLPETHKKYFLSASFTDFWRRINIYWKDFMQKLVFYPMYFRLRKQGESRALVIGTLAVFFVTWVTHSYQWFWLLGEYPMSLTDSLFWGILAVLLVFNTLYETKHGRRRSLGKRDWSVRAVAPVAVKTAGTFLVISLLWSLWTSPTLSDWFALLSVGGAGDGAARAIPWFLVVGLAVGGAAKSTVRRVQEKRGAPTGDRFTRSVTWTGAAILFVYLAGNPSFTTRLGSEVDGVATSLRAAELNKEDATLLQRGYYENLIGVSRFNSQLWEVYMQRPQVLVPIQDTEAGRRVEGFLAIELVPSQKIVFRGSVLTTNEWGMRDQSYDLAKPPGAFRIASLGASTTMGWSVGDEETFEHLVEERLNREGVPGVSYGRFESLNFAVPGYTTPQYLGQLDRVFTFGVDALFLTAQDNDIERTVTRLVDFTNQGIVFPFDSMQALADMAVEGAASQTEAEQRLTEHADDVLSWFYGEIVRRCRERGVVPVWMYLPQLERQATPEDKAVMFRTAEAAGFHIVDLSGVYDGREREDIIVSVWDYHPNRIGHQMVADRFFDELQRRPEIFTAAPAAGDAAP